MCLVDLLPPIDKLFSLTFEEIIIYCSLPLVFTAIVIVFTYVRNYINRQTMFKIRSKPKDNTRSDANNLAAIEQVNAMDYECQSSVDVSLASCLLSPVLTN